MSSKNRFNVGDRVMFKVKDCWLGGTVYRIDYGGECVSVELDARPAGYNTNLFRIYTTHADADSFILPDKEYYLNKFQCSLQAAL